ncbi:hypothetical protein [Tumebacillus flagellatus]|uniref:Uncharacterized protein n=1 Tax=Tumebacillus flagellatus TaxID=1157490 RepID=A0A074LLG0_9BACL|nr:hypothetical protein [Tumebacillus flagellatus]KEO82956.1 hypothetical protein EL26_12735 [Tumebacillus flagellatus]
MDTNKRKPADIGIPVAFGVVGFFFTGGLSLAAGNTVVTSIFRGAVGLFGAFFLGYIIRVALKTFVGSQEDAHAEVLGKHLDLLLPEQPQKKGAKSSNEESEETSEDISAEFVPWNSNPVSAKDKFEEIDPEKLADALRHLDE